MESEDVIRILKDVPECRLRLIQLANEVTGDDGAIDRLKVGYCVKELEEATKEAEAYVKATREAVQCLIRMARS